MRNLTWSHKQSPMLPLSFSLILAFLFLLQYLKMNRKELFKKLWITKKITLEEFTQRGSSKALIFFFPFTACSHAFAYVTSPAVHEKSICTPDGSGCPLMNYTILPPSGPFSNQPNPLPHAQPLTAPGVWEQFPHLLCSPTSKSQWRLLLLKLRTQRYWKAGFKRCASQFTNFNSPSISRLGFWMFASTCPFFAAMKSQFCREHACLFLHWPCLSVVSGGLLKELTLAAGPVSFSMLSKVWARQQTVFFFLAMKTFTISCACSWTMNYYWYLTKVLFFWLSPLCQTSQTKILLLEVFGPAAC